METSRYPRMELKFYSFSKEFLLSLTWKRLWTGLVDSCQSIISVIISRISMLTILQRYDENLYTLMHRGIKF